MVLKDVDILRHNHENSPLCIYSSFQYIKQHEMNRDRKENETESLWIT